MVQHATVQRCPDASFGPAVNATVLDLNQQSHSRRSCEWDHIAVHFEQDSNPNGNAFR